MRRHIRFVFGAPFRGYQDFTLAVLPGVSADEIAREAYRRAVVGFARKWTFSPSDRKRMLVNACDGLPTPAQHQGEAEHGV